MLAIIVDYIRLSFLGPSGTRHSKKCIMHDLIRLERLTLTGCTVHFGKMTVTESTDENTLPAMCMDGGSLPHGACVLYRTP